MRNHNRRQTLVGVLCGGLIGLVGATALTLTLYAQPGGKATKSQPKEMLPVARKPIVQYVVEELVSNGIQQILPLTVEKFEARFGFLVLFHGHHVDRAHGVHLLADLAVFLFAQFEFFNGQGFERLQANRFDGFIQLAPAGAGEMLEIRIDFSPLDFKSGVTILPGIESAA